MKKSRFSDSQILSILKQAEAGTLGRCGVHSWLLRVEVVTGATLQLAMLAILLALPEKYGFLIRDTDNWCKASCC